MSAPEGALAGRPYIAHHSHSIDCAVAAYCKALATTSSKRKNSRVRSGSHVHPLHAAVAAQLIAAGAHPSRVRFEAKVTYGVRSLRRKRLDVVILGDTPETDAVVEVKAPSSSLGKNAGNQCDARCGEVANLRAASPDRVIGWVTIIPTFEHTAAGFSPHPDIATHLAELSLRYSRRERAATAGCPDLTAAVLVDPRADVQHQVLHLDDLDDATVARANPEAWDLIDWDGLDAAMFGERFMAVLHRRHPGTDWSAPVPLTRIPRSDWGPVAADRVATFDLRGCRKTSPVRAARHEAALTALGCAAAWRADPSDVERHRVRLGLTRAQLADAKRAAKAFERLMTTIT